MNRRQFLQAGGSLGLGLSAASLLAACGGDDGGGDSGGEGGAVEITLLTVAGPRFGTAHKAVAEAFTKANPNITVNVDEVPLGDYYVRISNTLGSNSDRFDAIIVDPQQIPAIASKLTPLQPLIDQDAAYKADIEKAVPEEIRTYPSYDGQLYGLPTDTNVQLMWYRQDLLDAEGFKPPATYDDALEIVKALTRDTSDGKQYGFTTNLARNPYAGLTLAGIMNSYGGTMIDEEFRPQFLTDSGVAALEMLAELMKYADPGAVNAADNEVVQAFATGTAVFTPIAWTTNAFQNKDVNQHAEVTVAAPVPAGNLPGSGSYPLMAGLFYGMPKASRSPEEALAFGKYLSSADAMEVFVTNTGQPARLDALDEYQDVWPYFKALTDQLPTAKPFPRIPEYFPLMEPTGIEIAAVVDGEKSVEDALKTIDDTWTKTLSEAGYYD